MRKFLTSRPKTRKECDKRSRSYRHFCEQLESRIFLNGYTFTLADDATGNPATDSDATKDSNNGAYLMKLLQGRTTLSLTGGVQNHVLAQGDTLILTTGNRADGSMINWNLGASALALPNLGVAANVVLNSSGGVVSATPTFTGGNYGSSTSAPITFFGDGSGATGTAYIDPTGVTGYVISNNGNYYTSVPTVTFNNSGTGETTTAAATVVLTTYIDSAKITAGGTGYDANATVTFSGGLGTGGVAATGHVTITGGVIKNVLIDTPGSGYSSSPTLVFADPGGSGSGAAGYGGFGIDHLNITSYGAGYTSAPTLTFVGGGGSSEVVNPIIDGVTSIAITNAGSGYLVPPTVTLPTVTGTVTIETSALSSLPAGTRINPQNTTQEGYLARIISSSGAGIIETVTSDNYGHSGPAHDWSFLGIEVCNSDSTKTMTAAFVAIGTGGSAQDDISLVPFNFNIDRSYVHGGGFTTVGGTTTYIGDDQGNTERATNYVTGIETDGLNITVSNSYISDIHGTGVETHGIGGSNGLGNFTITNNFLEATGENFFNGGAVEYIPDATPNNIVFTHNYLFKRLAWDPYDPNYVPFLNNAGVEATMDVKNLFELKHATNVLVDSNLMENCWVGADQSAEAITIGPKNQGADSPWTVIAYVTITNNVIRNTGNGIDVATSDLTTSGHYTAQPLHDVLIQNNLIENMLAGADLGGGNAFSVLRGSSLTPGWNIVIDHNTVMNVDNLLTLDSGPTFGNVVSSGFSFTNNIVFFGQNGGGTSDGEGVTALQTYAPVANITNGGAGYTSTPTVTFSGGLGTGGVAANATAQLDASVTTYTITNGGSGYDTAPTIVYSDEFGASAAAAVTVNGSGAITAVTLDETHNLPDNGAGYTSAPTISLIGGGGTGAVITANMVDDGTGNGTFQIASFNIVSAGSGYSANTQVAIGALGAGAIITPVMGSDGAGKLKVVSLNIVNGGTGYVAPPSITFVGGGGTGAAATLGISGSIVGFYTNMTLDAYGNPHTPNDGSGYTSAPTITISGGGGSGATATTNLYAALASITVVNKGNGYTSAPTVTISGGGGSGAAGIATISGGKVQSVLITNVGGGYTSAPTITFVGGGYTTQATGTGVPLDTLVGSTFAGNVIIGTPQTFVSLYPNGVAGSNFYNNYVTVNEDNAEFADPSGDNFALLSTVAGGGSNPLKGYATNGTDPGANMAALAGITDFVQLDSTLQNYYKFDEGSGTTANDNGNGTHHNATLSSSSLWTTSAEINDGIALTGGTSGSVSVSSFSADSNFSFVAWVNSASTSATQYIASTANSAFSLYINSSGKLVASGTTGSITDSTALSTGTWYLVGVTFDGTNLRLYKNGVQVGSATAGTTTTGTTTLYIGGNQASVSSFNGTIDEVRYYSSALNGTITPISTITQMQELYNGFGPNVDTIAPGTNATQTSTTTRFSVYADSHADSTWTTVPNNRTPPPSLTFTWTPYSYEAPGSTTWTLYSTPGNTNPAVTFDSNNGTNAGYSSVATWAASGNYEIELAVTDLNGKGATTYNFHQETVNLNAPAAPTSLGATAGASSIGLSWTDNATNETGFHIWQSTDGVNFNEIASVGPSSGTGGTVTFTDSTTTDPGFTLGVTYSYYVTAYNGSGDSADSNTVTATAGIPAAPVITSALPHSDNVGIDLAWTESTGGVTGYNIQRSSDGGTTWASVATGVTTTNYTDSTVAGDTSYIYQVNAYITVGLVSSWSASSSSVLTIPATPTSVSATPSTSAYSIGLTWSEGGNGASSYAIQRSANGGSTWSSVASGITGTSYTDSTGLSGNTFYIYQVDATDATGTTAWSSSSNSALTIPAGASNLAATPGTSTIALTWTDPTTTTNITGYHIYRSTDNATWGSVYGTASGATATTFTDSSPGAGTAYYYKVVAYDATGESATAAGMTCYVATVIAYDGFNYGSVTGANPWSGGNTGVGFSSGWTISNTSHATVGTSSLTYSNSGHGLTTSADDVTLTSGTSAKTTTTATLGTAGSTLWVSYEMSTTGTNGKIYIGDNSGTNYVAIGVLANSDFQMTGTVGANSYTANTLNGPTANTTYFLVAEIQYLTTGDVLNIWVDPIPENVTTPAGSLWSATRTMPSTSQLTSTNTVVMLGNTTDVSTYDELRLGATFASVAPDPLVDMPPAHDSDLPAVSPISLLTAAAPAVTVDDSLSPIFSSPIADTISIDAPQAASKSKRGAIGALATVAPRVSSPGVHQASPTYHTYFQENSDSNPLTLDNPDDLLIQF